MTVIEQYMFKLECLDNLIHFFTFHSLIWRCKLLLALFPADSLMLVRLNKKDEIWLQRRDFRKKCSIA